MSFLLLFQKCLDTARKWCNPDNGLSTHLTCGSLSRQEEEFLLSKDLLNFIEFHS